MRNIDTIKKVQQGHFNNCSLKTFIRLMNYLQYNENYKLNITFTSSYNLGANDCEISRIVVIDRIDDELKIQVIANILGLIGPTGILPLHYTRLIIDAARHKDHDLHNFINIFYNKIMHLFVEIINQYDYFLIFEKYTYNVEYQQQHIMRDILNIVGLSSTTCDIPPVMFYYTGLLANFSRSTVVLENILSNYLLLPVNIEQFIKEKINIAVSDITKLAISNNILGDSLYLGQHTYFYQHKINIQIRELTLKQYNKYIESNSQVRQIISNILNCYLNNQIKYTLEFKILEQEKLTNLTDKPFRKLGRTLWLKAYRDDYCYII